MSPVKHSILIASNNAHKLQEFREIFVQFGASNIEIFTPQALGLAVDPDEIGETYLDNARIKARAFHHLLRKSSHRVVSVFADDSGLEVDALRGAPGIHFYSLNKSRSVMAIARNLSLTTTA